MKNLFAFICATALAGFMFTACGNSQKGNADSKDSIASETQAKAEIVVDENASLNDRITSYLSQADSIVWEQKGAKGKKPTVILYANGHRVAIHRNTGTFEDFDYDGTFIVAEDRIEINGKASAPAIEASGEHFKETWPQEFTIRVSANLGALTFSDESWKILTDIDPVFNKSLLEGENVFNIVR